MFAADATRLNQIAFGTEVTPASRKEHYAPGSALRMEAAARAVLDHSVQFNLDGEGPDGGIPAVSYIASLITDLLVLAQKIDISAEEVLDVVVNYTDGTDLVLPRALG